MGNEISVITPVESLITQEPENHYDEFLEEFVKKHVVYRKGAHISRDILLRAFYTFCDFKEKPVKYVGFYTTLNDIAFRTLKINNKTDHVMFEHYKEGKIGSEYWNTIIVNLELSSYPTLDVLPEDTSSSEKRDFLFIV